MMARPVSAIKAFGLTALLLLASSPPSNSNGSSGLFASASTTSLLDSTTGGAPDAGTVTMDDDYEDPCDATPAPSAAIGSNDTPSPVVSNRCIPIATSYDDSFTDSELAAAPAAATPVPSEAAATPEPTLTGGGGGGGADIRPSASPTTMMPSAGGPAEDGPGDVPGGDGPGDVTNAPLTPGPTASSSTEGGDGDREVVVDDDSTPTPTPAGAGIIPETAGPTNEDGQTAGDDTDGASGLAPPGPPVAALAAALGIVLAAAVLAP